MKTIVILISVLFFVGCATGPYKPLKKVKKTTLYYQEHPDYGEVLDDHPEYLKAKEECKKKVYVEGVAIGDEVVFDADRLLNIYSDHLTGYIENRMLKKLDVNRAYHGANAKVNISVPNTFYSYGNESLYKSYAGYFEEYTNIPKPEGIEKIDALRNKNIACMRDEKKWKAVRVVEKNSETGEIISDFKFK